MLFSAQTEDSMGNKRRVGPGVTDAGPGESLANLERRDGVQRCPAPGEGRFEGIAACGAKLLRRKPCGIPGISGRGGDLLSHGGPRLLVIGAMGDSDRDCSFILRRKLAKTYGQLRRFFYDH